MSQYRASLAMAVNPELCSSRYIDFFLVRKDKQFIWNSEQLNTDF